ncbi:trans-Golgi network-localized SYP41-interacting protein 1-like [Curcuma longa]|uniref:trans-Golgi network-localized SYP41-interacting protein 1-like n=1 Tax=Curcuma longa TaxID=136217 RepID=UPI003D9DC6E5
MPDRSDSDSSPKSPDGSQASSSGEEVRPLPDPGSPSNAQQSSDEGGSSDGVLVDLPGQTDQDSRSMPGDPDTGILVNIDGSMQESVDESGREETFEDASDSLSRSESSRSLGLEESMAVIEFGERSDSRLGDDELARVQARLEDTIAECQKCKEERETFGKEIVSLRQNLQDILDQHSLLAIGKKNDSVSLPRLEAIESDDRSLSSPTPLHSMFDDCSKLLTDLKAILAERMDSDSKIMELHGALDAKDQEIEELNAKVSGSSLSHDIIISYLDSFKETQLKTVEESINLVAKRLLDSLETVVGQHPSAEDSPIDGLSRVEKKTLLLIEKHSKIVSEIHLLKQSLKECNPAFAAMQDDDLGKVFSFVREELFESKRNEANVLDSIKNFEEENKKLLEQVEKIKENLDKAQLETNQTKAELEQAENKYMTTKEKLSMAVSKGKSLVQHRDALKQSLAEKTNELEKCMEELQQKSEALHTTEASLDELKQLLNQNTNELETCLEKLQIKTIELENAKLSIEDLNANCIMVNSLHESLSQRSKCLLDIEEIMSLARPPQEVLSLEIVDRVRWFINQKAAADAIVLENRKIRDALSSIELPEDVSFRELDYQIDWFVKEFNRAKDDNGKLQNEISSAQIAMASQQSEMSEAHKGIDSLESYLLEEKLAKEVLHNELKELQCQYDDIVQRSSSLSSDKDQLLKALLELSENTLDCQLPVDISSTVDRCVIKISEKMASSLTRIEQIERMQCILYITDQDLKLHEQILDDDLLERSATTRLSDELTKLSNEAVVLKNDKESVQKELERVEEKNSLLREKLSMAVKKGKGLVQEREGFKTALDEKTFEIEKLKRELQLKDGTINEYQEQINNLSTNIQHIEKLEAAIVSLKNERNQSQQSLHETSTKLDNLISCVEKIVVPTVSVFEGPLEKVNWIAEYIQQSEVAKSHALEELEKLQQEASLQARRLSNATKTIKALEEEKSEADNYISLIFEEKNAIQLGKVSIEQELRKLKEEVDFSASKLSEAYASIKLLEDELEKAQKDIAQLQTDRNNLEAKSDREIFELNAKLAECREKLLESHGSMEKYSIEMHSQLGHLIMFMKDKSLLSIIAEESSKSTDGFRKMNSIIQNMHNHFASKQTQVLDMEDEPAFDEIPLPETDDFTNNWNVQFEGKSTIDSEDVPDITKIVAWSHARAEHLENYFSTFFKGLEKHIASILRGLQVTRNEFVHILELSETMKSETHKLEAHNEAQAKKLVSLQKGITALFSACNDATRELAELSDSRDSSSNTVSDSHKESFSGGTEEDVDFYPNVADNLLFSVNRIKNHFQQLLNVENIWLTSVENMENKLKEAESITKTSVEQRMISQERVSILERDLEALNELCSDLKTKIENYQAKEDLLGDKVLLTTQHALDRGMNTQLLSESQVSVLMDKVNKLEIPYIESGTLDAGVHFSDSVEKLFFIVDEVNAMQQKMEILSHEKEDMHLILASHAHEIEHLKKAIEENNTHFQELELKKNDLLEMSEDLERIIKKLGGYDALRDQKSLNSKLLLTMLDRLITASMLESKKLKSRAQEFEANLQAKDDLVHELSDKVKTLEDSIHARSLLLESTKESTIFEATPSKGGSEISEIEDVGPLGKNSILPVSTAAQLRTMRKGSDDHLVLNIDSGSDHSVVAAETDAKGHVFKSLNTSGLIPKQGKLIADRLDSIWVSGEQLLMRRPGARLSLIVYSFLVHLWLLGAIL